MDAKLVEMLGLLRDADYVRPEELAHHLGVSVRTVRTYVARANETLGPQARIVIKRGRGYQLVGGDELPHDGAHVPGAGVPSTREERISYLIDDLLARDDWITIDHLSQILYISRRTISNNLKDVEAIIRPFGLKLEKRPRYGVRVTGSEMGRRLCLAHRAMSGVRGPLAALGLEQDGGTIDAVSACVDRALQAAGGGFHVRSAAYQNLLVHIAIAVERIRRGMYVPLKRDDLDELKQTPEYPVARRIAQEVSERFSIGLPEEEVAYIAIHLAGKQVIDPVQANGCSVEISDEVWGLVSRMLDAVWEAFRFDFRGDLELRMNLARHIVPLLQRLRYHMELKNPLVHDVRSRFPLAFDMARESAVVLEREQGSTLSDDEVAYIAFAFALALERQKSARPKKNIVIVCASGAGSARLLEYRYRREFEAYLGDVIACDVSQLDALDFSHIDYVFTTVPLNRDLPVPVRRVGFFLDEPEIKEVRDLFESEGLAACTSFFSGELFFAHAPFADQQTAVHELVAALRTVDELPDSFEELVFARERAAPTAFGNRIAIPHPIDPVGTKTLVAVALLDTPIRWGPADAPDAPEVQVIFLISIAQENFGDLSGLYERISRLLTDAAAIDSLLRDQTLANLFRLMAG